MAGEEIPMGVRRSLVGLLFVVSASLVLAADGLGAGPPSEPLPGASPVATTAPAPRASAPGAVLPTPLETPHAVPSVGDASPSPRPSAAIGGRLGTLFPFPIASGAPAAQNYALFIRNAERQTGVIDLVRKDDELYFDLRPENFNKPYIILPSIASGIGGAAFAGRVFDPLVVEFKRVGRRVLWITPNTRYVAAAGSAAAASLAVSVANSTIQATPVLAEDAAKDHVVIAPSIFLSDFEGIGAEMGRGVTPPSLPGLLVLVVRPSFGVDATKSYYLATKAFPLNDEVSVNLAFNGPANALPTVPDGRGIPIVVHYSIVAPPVHDPTYVPRYADDRIGYFITARKQYDKEAANTPFERFIDRWNLAAGPIVFTLTNEIPLEYRDTVRRGILAWNDAFAQVGYPHAIEVRDPPTDASFDPEDARYNSVRWITSDRPDFVAISPHVSDPDTGQIIRAEVVIDGESLRSVRRGFVERNVPIQRQREDAFAPPIAALQFGAHAADGETQPPDAMSCDLEDASTIQGAIGMSMLAGNPRVTPADRERYVQDWLLATVLHEVGHTFGLRHNFEGSTAYTYAQLHDPAFTKIHGTTASVMDYTPPNIAAPNEVQADYFPTKPGKYDNWAIEYGYTKTAARTSEGELPILHRIAGRSTEPGLAYGTDEDATPPYAIDPHIQRFDLSSDPLAYAQEQFLVNDVIVKQLTGKHRAGDERSFQDIRETFVTVLNNELASASVATHYIGGIFTSRNHRGQPGATAPFTPVARAEQRRAFALLERYIFSSHAFSYSPVLLNDAAPGRFGIHWDSGAQGRPDFPIREVVGEIQDDVIASMFNPSVLSRLADQSLKTRPGQTMSLADLFGWTNAAIFDDLGKPTIAPLHRDLQRRFTDLEVEIAFLPSTTMDQLALPREIQALARYDLRRLAARLPAAVGAATDTATKAHLDDLRTRLAGALDPHTNRSI